MKRLQCSIVFSQRTWVGVGDLDDCWVLSLLQCIQACAPWLVLPGTGAVRAAAGNPDDGNHDGGSLPQLVKAVHGLWPEVAPHLTELRGGTVAALEALVKAGRPVSVAIMCNKLPPRLQYGCTGATAHQVTLAATPPGGLIMANPLAQMGSHWDEITWADVLPAVKAYGNGSAYALAFPTIDAMAPSYPGVAELVAAAHAKPDPAALAAAAAEGGRTARAATKAAAVAAVSGIPG